MTTNFNFTESGYTPSYSFNFSPPPTPPVSISIYSVLAGASNNFTAIWADSDAGLETGSFYIASAAAFSAVKDTVLINAFTYPTALDQNDIIDINA